MLLFVSWVKLLYKLGILLIIINIIKDTNESKIEFLAKKINADAATEKEKIKRWRWFTIIDNFTTSALRFIFGLKT